MSIYSLKEWANKFGKLKFPKKPIKFKSKKDLKKFSKKYIEPNFESGKDVTAKEIPDDVLKNVFVNARQCGNTTFFNEQIQDMVQTIDQQKRLVEFEKVFEFIENNDVSFFKYGHGYKAAVEPWIDYDADHPFGKTPLEAIQNLIKETEKQ